MRGGGNTREEPPHPGLRNKAGDDTLEYWKTRDFKSKLRYMPFTFAHPAIVLPLYTNIIFSRFFTLLVIGSMSPDFEYFLRLQPYSKYSHTLLGIFYFCIPISLFIFFIYEKTVKPALARYFLRKEINVVTIMGNTKNILLGITAIAIGAFSHIFWDSFTHKTGFFVAHYPIFFQHSFGSVPMFKILQHGSTLLGGLIICIFLWSRLSTRLFLFQKFTYTTFAICVILIIVGGSIIPKTFHTLGQLVITLITSFFISILISSVALKD